MPADTKKVVNNALASLPDREVIRQRIAENLQERTGSSANAQAG